MRATSQHFDPVPDLVDQLVDGLHLLYECRRRGVIDVDRLLEYLEHTMDQIERERLGMSTELFHSALSADETELLAEQRRMPRKPVLAHRR